MHFDKARLLAAFDAVGTRTADHLEFGTFPRGRPIVGLSVWVPAPEYMLALKLKAARTLDPVKGQVETDDIYSLLKLLNIDDADQALAVLGEYFPNSAKQRFPLKHLDPSDSARTRDAPRYDP